MKVFLAGATGAIGRKLLPQLLAAGHQVVAMTRSSAGAARLQVAGARPFDQRRPPGREPPGRFAVASACPQAAALHLSA